MSRSKCRSFRLVALDIDGTVVDSAQRVSERLKRVLALLASRGVRTVLCTGRRWRTSKPVLEALEHVDPVVICSGGALIKQAEGERTLHREPLPLSAARTALDAFVGAGLVPFVLLDRPAGEPELRCPASLRRRAEALRYLLMNPGACAWFEGEWPSDADEPLVVYTVDFVGAVRNAEQRVRSALEGQANVNVLAQPKYGADQLAIEVHSPAATKWSAIEWLLRRWGLRPEQVVAVGDDVNDIPMLRGAGLSFAMGNSPEPVKRAAKAVTESNERDGVAVALMRAFELREVDVG